MMWALRLAVAAILALVPFARAQPWVDEGPAPTTGFGGATGRVSAIVCSRTDPNRYYVAGATGGVWRTRNGGESWTPLTDHAPTTSIGALAFGSADERVIYAGTGEANFANHSRYGLGLLRSTDEGETWDVLGQSAFAGRCISDIVVDPSGTLYVATARAGGFPTRAAAFGHPLAEDPVGVFKSADAGSTWSMLAGGLPSADVTGLVMDPRDARVLYACVGVIFGSPDNGVYKTTDAGATWTRLAPGIPDGTSLGRTGIALAPSNPDRVYVLAVNPADATGGGATSRAICRSDNAGASFTAFALTSMHATYGWYFTPLSVRPTNANEAYFGGLTLRRTTNAGSSTSNIAIPHPDVHAFAWDAAGRLLMGDDGGLHRQDAPGLPWASLNNGLSIIQAYAGLSSHPTDDTFVLAGLQDNGTVRHDTPTPLWTSIAGGDGGWTQIDQTSPLRVFCESQGTGNINRSTNGGTSFSWIGADISGRNCFLPPYLIDPANPLRMLYATERVWVSTNGGTNWQPLSQDLTSGGSAAIRALAIAPSDSRFVYAATNDGRVLASEDSGATFALRLTGNPGWPRVTRELCVDPSDPRTVYLAGAAFGVAQVRRSTDAGATWESLDADLPDIPVHVIGVSRSPALTIYAGTDQGVYVSRDAAASWRRLGDGLPNAPVTDLLVQPERGRLLAGTMGRGVWTFSLACRTDFNGDGVSDQDDVAYLIHVIAGGDNPTGADPDVTHDGVVDQDDVWKLIDLIAGGVCP